MGKEGLSIMAYKLWIGKRRAIYNGTEKGGGIYKSGEMARSMAIDDVPIIIEGERGILRRFRSIIRAIL